MVMEVYGNGCIAQLIVLYVTIIKVFYIRESYQRESVCLADKGLSKPRNSKTLASHLNSSSDR